MTKCDGLENRFGRFRVFSLTTGAHDLGHWAGFGLFRGYAAAAVAIAAVLLRRDT